MYWGINPFCRNSISAELPLNTTNTPNSNLARDQNETQVAILPDSTAHFNNSSNDNLSSIDFHEGPIDFAEPSDNETGELFDFGSTIISTSSTTVTSTTSTMISTTSTTSTTETSTTKEFFIARNKASSVIDEIKKRSAFDREDAFAMYTFEFVRFQIYIFYNTCIYSIITSVSISQDRFCWKNFET